VYAAVAGALHRYCVEQGFKFPEKTLCRALVPVVFPRAVDAPLLNDWSINSVTMPIEKQTAKERLEDSNAIFSELKQGSNVLVTRHIADMNAKLPEVISQMVAADLFNRHTIVFSNVPGPTEHAYLAGKKVVAIRPVYCNLLPQFMALSYCGDMYMSITIDDKVATQPDRLGDLYMQEIEVLAKLVGVDPKDDSPVPGTPSLSKV